MPRSNTIVIGGSAGSIQVLQTVISGLPDGFDVPIFIAIHRGLQDGILADILARKTQMQVMDAKNGLRIARQTVYVAPPDRHLLVHSSHVWLSGAPKVNRHRPAIDPLFESAASEFGASLIGVVLSGFLDDGTMGLAAIKAHGGIAVVQDPRDAYAPYMPGNALARVAVDYCVPAAAIAPLLVKLTTGKGPEIPTQE